MVDNYPDLRQTQFFLVVLVAHNLSICYVAVVR